MTNTAGLHDLIFKIARGDRRAEAEFDALVRDPLTQHIANKFGSDLTDGDIHEVVSQSILTMFLQARGYCGRNGDASAWAWAYQIARNQALKWSKDFLEAGKQRLVGDVRREADRQEVQEMRGENEQLKVVVAELTLKNRMLKKSLVGKGMKWEE